MDKSTSRFRISHTRNKDNGEVLIETNGAPISLNELRAGLESAITVLENLCSNAKLEGHIPERNQEPETIYDIDSYDIDS